MGMEKGSGLNFGPYDYNGGGGNPQPPTPTPQGEYFVKVIDYDGTVLDEQWLDDGAEYTLPSAPSHEGLVFQEWSCSQTITNGKITIDKNNVMIGAVYTTASGKNEFDMVINEYTGMTVNLKISGEKDWGDGTIDTETSHTYSQAGEYTITTSSNSISFNYNKGVFDQSSSVPNKSCIRARLSNISTIGSYFFANCTSLEELTISNSATSFNNAICYSCERLKSFVIPSTVVSNSTYLQSCFNYCHSIKHIVIPYSFTKIGGYVFSGLYSIEEFVIPKTLISIGNYNFDYAYKIEYLVVPSETVSNNVIVNCTSLKKLKITSDVTSIGTYAFSGLYSLEECDIEFNVTTVPNGFLQRAYNLKSKITFSSSVTTIGDYAFDSCLNITEYDFSSATSVPTLSGTNAFNLINVNCKIKVPTALYDSWIVATNWSALASLIVAV